ncbi:two-component system, NarL family, sensor kinase [Nitrosospira multiformis]|uniref:Two-component system, NarL family, sensor kinase n=1 Tax=Nitrosospira multiformis TaxID=1231 RepID=A0A1H8EWZ0_9PROT|nr:cache domain-containing protein [Nitrosospira multiformis]SEN23417.1 two-component system, NarL family, sensor kinase [Nitrosospira multiformis]
MELRLKILLFAVLPLAIALGMIAITVRHHALSLAQQQQSIIKPAYLATKDVELKSYVAIAKRAIAHLYDSGRTDEAIKREAKAILERLEYGKDGYFFVYDLQSTMLVVHPRMPESVGKNMGSDPIVGPLIKDLIRLSQNSDGGYRDYFWQKYSGTAGSSDPKPKRAYVIDLPKWGWMLGTGVYLDDVDDALTAIELKVARNIDHTMLWIAAIAVFSAIAIFLGLMRNIRERTALDDMLHQANLELRALAQRVINARDEERKRIEKDLHDGVKPSLVAVKLKIQTGLIQLPKSPEETTVAENTFQSASVLLKESLLELTNIIRGIRPSGSLSLAQMLKKLTLDMTHPALAIEFNAQGETHGLTSDAEQVLFLVAKEALTNVVSYAAAKHVSVKLEGTAGFVRLEICDDGVGFDVALVSKNPGQSTGLRNMKERVESVGGKFEIISSPSATCVIVTIPLSNHPFNNH